MRVSLAKILALPENKQGLAKKHAAAFTVKSSVSLAWLDPVTYSLRMSQQSLLTDSEQSSLTFPRSGMIRNGYVYELPTVGRIIKEIDGGSWLSTPSASDVQLERRAKHGEHFVTATGTVRRLNKNGTSSNLGLAGLVKMCPTPSSNDWKGSSKPGQRRRQLTDPAMGIIQVGGKLNPTWEEWLMGFPLGFTVSKAWVTPKSRCKPQSHGNCSEVSN